MKKHYTQMTQEEHDYLMSRFEGRDRGSWYVSAYCHRRLIKRSIAPIQLLDLFNVNRLIEYHYAEQDDSERILLRGRAHKGRELCAVFNLTNGQVVTIWTNWEGNQHDRVDMSEYDINCPIIQRTEAG